MKRARARREAYEAARSRVATALGGDTKHATEARGELGGFDALGMMSSCVAAARSKIVACGDKAAAEFNWLPANPQPNLRLCGFDCGLAARKSESVVQVQVGTPRPHHIIQTIRSLMLM